MPLPTPPDSGEAGQERGNRSTEAEVKVVVTLDLGSGGSVGRLILVANVWPTP
jgi:hypothetical protein